MGRRDKNNYYLDLADVVSERSTCLRRRFGAVIVKDDEVIASGSECYHQCRKKSDAWLYDVFIR